MIKKRRIIITLLIAVFLALTLPFFIFQFGKSKIYYSINDVEQTSIAIIFGAGLKINGTPSDALMDRLEVAVELYKNQTIKSILVSGDNQSETYNEPEAMRTALINLGVDESDIYLDYAGRRTYDTCIRAKTLWGVDKALLISQGYHLPRAIWTCRALGIKSTGISASLQPYAKQDEFETREILALYKMLIDLYIWSPNYMSGEPITNLAE